MTLLLTDDEIAGLRIGPGEVYAATEQAFRELGRGEGVNPPRRRMYVPRAQGLSYRLNNLMGALPSMGLCALRIDSALLRTAHDDDGTRQQRNADFIGLIFLFSLDSPELVAILHDHWISARRVAATTALGVDRLARPDARVLGLFGSGHQAAAQVEALALVRALDEVRVHSPNPVRRQALVDRLRAEGHPAHAVGDPREAVEGCDIVVTATSSRTPVFDGTWLGPGTHVTTIVGGDPSSPGSEIDSETVARADLVVVNSREQATLDQQPKLLGPAKEGLLAWDRVTELSLLVAGGASGRPSRDAITLHDNNTGLGVQFAAVGALVVRHAHAGGVGTPMDGDWFVTKGAYAR